MFTELELVVLKALFESSKGNGHDFGFIEDARGSVGKEQLSGVVSSLVQKGVLTFDKIKTESGTWHQFQFCDGMFEKVKGVIS